MKIPFFFSKCIILSRICNFVVWIISVQFWILIYVNWQFQIYYYLFSIKCKILTSLQEIKFHLELSMKKYFFLHPSSHVELIETNHKLCLLTCFRYDCSQLWNVPWLWNVPSHRFKLISIHAHCSYSNWLDRHAISLLSLLAWSMHSWYASMHQSKNIIIKIVKVVYFIWVAGFIHITIKVTFTAARVLSFVQRINQATATSSPQNDVKNDYILLK